MGMLIAAALLALAALLYWLLVATEGTYLGARIVTLLYDLTANRYDKIKALHYVAEARYVGLPLVEALGGVRSPRVLDVAAGTGRVPLALLRAGESAGPIIAVDRSSGMLGEAKAALAGQHGAVTLIQGDAAALSFANGAFDCVTCLEALEFMWDPAETVSEMVRVLKAGGVLLLSNRVGTDAWLLPRRLCGRGRLERHLGELGLEEIQTQRWQVHYDLIWARKPSASALGRPLCKEHADDRRASVDPERTSDDEERLLEPRRPLS